MTIFENKMFDMCCVLHVNVIILKPDVSKYAILSIEASFCLRSRFA